jgi:regulatory protein
LKQVGDYCVKKALKEIDEAEYLRTFKKMAEQKLATLKSEKNIFVKKSKLQNFLYKKDMKWI